MKYLAGYIILGLFLTGCSRGQTAEDAFRERTRILIDYAADIYRPPKPNYSDPEKVYWPKTIARLHKYGIDDSLANHYLEMPEFTGKSPFHFILVGMARIMPAYSDAPALKQNQLTYLDRIMERRDSYNPWTAEGTENHINMSRASGYIFAEIMEDYPDRYPEATRLKNKMKEWITYYSKRIYQVGTGEFNASTYGAFNIIPWLNLYDFARDPEIRLMARAVLDYYAAELALHYTQGMTGSAESRGAPSNTCVHHETEYIAWLWFGDVPRDMRKTLEKDPGYKPPLQSVHAATSSYRPPAPARTLAVKRIREPEYYRNSKPSYLLAEPSYIKHVFYIDSLYTLGSAFYPYGAFMSSAWKNTTWKLVSRVDPEARDDPQMVTGGGMFYPDRSGKIRNPWHQVAQYRNVLIQMNKTPGNARELLEEIKRITDQWRQEWRRDFIERFSATDDKIVQVGNPVKFQEGGISGDEGNGCYISFPDDVAYSQIRGQVFFIKLDHSYLAVRSISGDRPALKDENLIVDQAPVGALTGLILEVHPADEFDDFDSFQQSYSNRTKLDRTGLTEKDEIIYTTMSGDRITMRYREEGSFTEPLYDWGYGPDTAMVIPGAPPFRQPEWHSGKGYGRLAQWWVNEQYIDLQEKWPVYCGPQLKLSDSVLVLGNGGTEEYRVDYSGELPVFMDGDLGNRKVLEGINEECIIFMILSRTCFLSILHIQYEQTDHSKRHIPYACLMYPGPLPGRL